MRTRSAASAAAAIASTSRALAPIGFSVRTCLPACSIAIDCSECSELGLAM